MTLTDNMSQPAYNHICFQQLDDVVMDWVQKFFDRVV